jgi:hypothetical protein
LQTYRYPSAGKIRCQADKLIFDGG